MIRNPRVIVGILLSVIFIQTLVILKFFLKKKPSLPSLHISGRIAIILDDWGYNLNNIEMLKEINYPLTLAILPHLEYSWQIFNIAQATDKETILHLPLEPKGDKGYTGWEKFTITTNMSEEKIRDMLIKAIDSLPYIKGVSNHMGSRATEDERTMMIIFKELKKRGLYFMDSKVSPNSICKKIAERFSVPFISRDIFLDNQKDPLYIKNQFKKLKLKAQKKGWAVGVGHCHHITLKVLKEELPLAEKEGFRFVFLSELVK